jgi:hypothetical protein
LGARLSYTPQIFRDNGSGSKEFFKSHSFEFGPHFDLHLERTASFSLNAAKQLNLGEGSTKKWGTVGDFYFGSTYILERT